jgi:hypothetical protein
MDGPTERWQWPSPPFAWRHLPPPGNDVAQPCRIESHGGAWAEGQMLGFDPVAASLGFRGAEGGPAVTLPFSRFRRLTLTAPLKPAPLLPGAPLERIPAAAQERDYRLWPRGAGQPLTGRTAGHVETADGLYLFTPVNEEMSLQRLFVPRAVYERCELGLSAEEIAAKEWIGTPDELLAAIERQQRMPVLPIGHSLLALGLLTQNQLKRALAHQPGNVPLGEMLVSSGVVSRSDLQTAIAHKMGYPLVDLSRFPVDPVAVQKLPQRLALWSRALPLMIDGHRLIVAVDKPSRAVKLGALHAYAQLTVVPVLASKAQLILALSRLSQQDIWSQNVATRVEFFATTL